ncbi:dextranase [Paenibacillus taihuensis]|uniref:Dextranase n=1 Tax=Paenibacillus taihuensis TaxID=1156355 RepID=A0A3D9S418_9BACL|nr:glycoside hydrolase family 66 protein [Paenibacillus taihuensis]REE87402.1 dextranase [Paenibacillus taihuensis]
MNALSLYPLHFTDAYPLKAQFRSGERIRLAVELETDGIAASGTFALRVNVYELQTLRETRIFPLMIDASSPQRIELEAEAGPYECEFTGFGCDLELICGDAIIDSLSTAFDVVSDWRKATRYGFLSEYEAGREEEDERKAKWLTKLHLNLTQYYDWMYRHDDLVAQTETYTDLMGRQVSLSAIRNKLTLGRKYGMKSIAYGAVYAASKAFAERNPDWGLYTSAGEPYDFIGIFRIMNIEPESPWHAHIIGEYAKSVAFGFDGIHLDTYGFPKTAWSRLGGEQRLIKLEEQFPVFIDHTREKLSPLNSEACLIFNNVGNWPVNSVAKADQDAIYIEVWKPYERYQHLREIIAMAQTLSGGKNVILAAYLQPFRLASETLGVQGAENGLRLLTATVTAHGAYHLLHGEDGGILTQGYYVDHSQLRDSFRRTVRDYADFIVRYGHLTHDVALRDVSMTHADYDNMEYVFRGFAFSTYGEPGKVWTIVREKTDVKLIHFINLAGVTNDLWNEAKETPADVQGREVRVLCDSSVRAIFLVTPDRDQGRPLALEYRLETSDRGMIAVIALPDLHYWDMLVIQFEEASNVSIP